MSLITKPCPFCQNNHLDNATGGACCFCDYEGIVTIGINGVFSNIDQYNEIYYANNFQEQINKLHDRHLDNKISNQQLN